MNRYKWRLPPAHEAPKRGVPDAPLRLITGACVLSLAARGRRRAEVNHKMESLRRDTPPLVEHE